jgi:hypothetical protein
MNKLFKFLILWYAPYFAFAFYLIWRRPLLIAGMARWVWWVAFCYFIGGIIVFGLTSGRRKTIPASAKEKTPLTKNTARTLKGGLILYVLIFLNGAGYTISGRIPFWFAVPGLIVDALLIALFLWLLARQKSRTGSEI